MKLPFKATVRDAGGYFVVTIPKPYIDNGLLTEGKEHEFFAEVPDVE